MTIKSFFYTLIGICCFAHVLLPQAQVVFNVNNNVYARISGNAFLTIDNANPTAIISSSVANIISESEYNAVKWHIQNNTGNYVVPFATNSLAKIPLQLNITTAGVSNNSSIIFSTYETTTDKNSPYPSDVTHLNSNCKDSMGLYAVDRYWRIDAENYTTKPTPIISFGYDNSANEIALTNTITETALKAQRFNNTINAWETPQKLYGQANTSAKNVHSVLVQPSDFYKSWALIDSTVLVLPVSITSSSVNSICAGSQAVISATGATSYTLMPNNISSTSQFSVAPTSTTTYSLIGSIGSGSLICLSYPSSALVVTVTVNASPSITTLVSDVTCFGENTGSISTSITATSAFTYTWSNGSNIGSIANLPAGIYSLQVQDANGCAGTQTMLVNQPTALVITELSNQPSCDNTATGQLAITVTGGVANYSLLWDNGTNGTALNQLPAGAITATVTDANGCKTNFSKMIQVETCLVTLIPQLFTPNADGKNDLFYINTIAYFPNNTLEIYNRWGNLVYRKAKYNNEFDGKANLSNVLGNGLLPAGTYFVVFDFGDGKTEPYSGYLELKY